MRHLCRVFAATASYLPRMQRVPDCLHGVLALTKEIARRNSEHAETGLFQICSTSGVESSSFRLIVLRTVEFDRQLTCKASEVDGTVAKRDLASKLEAGEPSSAQ